MIAHKTKTFLLTTVCKKYFEKTKKNTIYKKQLENRNIVSYFK